MHKNCPERGVEAAQARKARAGDTQAPPQFKGGGGLKHTRRGIQDRDELWSLWTEAPEHWDLMERAMKTFATT